MGMGWERSTCSRSGRGGTEVRGTFQMQICHERTLERFERRKEVIGFAIANATGQSKNVQAVFQVSQSFIKSLSLDSFFIN